MSKALTFVHPSSWLTREAARTFLWGQSDFLKRALLSIACPQWLITGVVTAKKNNVLYCLSLQIGMQTEAGDWIKMKTKSGFSIWYSRLLFCGIQRKLSIRPCLDSQYLTREPKSCRPEVCAVLYRMSHSLSRRLEQVQKSELEQQESEQKQGRGDARAGMGTCCCSCLPLSSGADWADRETQVVAELEDSRLEEKERQTETR